MHSVRLIIRQWYNIDVNAASGLPNLHGPDFVKSVQIGTGAFTTAFLATTRTGETMCIKAYDISSETQRNKKVSTHLCF